MTRVALTGSTGFIGRHLVRALLDAGHDVRVLIRGGAAEWNPSVDVVRGDVRSIDAIRSLLDGCDVAVHLAGGFTSGASVADVIVGGTRSLVTVAGDAGLSRIVYMSCMGAQAGATSPFYGAKWTAETLVRGSEVPWVILRPSLVLGKGDGVVDALSLLVRRLPAIPLPGRGDQRHQPIDVGDLCRCVLAAATEESLLGQSVSVGGPTFLTLRQLVDLIAAQHGVCKPKLLLPPPALPVLSHLLPARSRTLFAESRLAQFQLGGAVVSPGIVTRTFGFTPRSILEALDSYLA